MNITHVYKSSVYKISLIFLVALIFFSGIATGCSSKDSVTATIPVAFSEEEYEQSNNAEQGVNNWFYCFGNARGNYYLLNYDSAMSKWTQNDPLEPNLMINSDEVYAGKYYQTIKLWVAPSDGVADVGLTASLKDAHSQGVTVSVIHKSNADGQITQIGEKTVDDSKAVDLSMKDVSVQEGDCVFFTAKSNGDNEKALTTFKTGVRFNSTVKDVNQPSVKLNVMALSGASRTVNWQNTFSTVQGEKNWYFCYGLPQKYKYLNYGYKNSPNDPDLYPDDSELGWRAGHDIWYQEITEKMMHPGPYRWSTLKVWVAKQDGVVSLIGDVTKVMPKNNGVSDGVDVAVYFNGEKKFSKNIGGYDTTPYAVSGMQNLAVKKGDTIILEVNAGRNYNSANDYVKFAVDVFWEEEQGNYTANEDYSKYLSIVQTEAEMIGVIDVPKTDKDFDKES